MSAGYFMNERIIAPLVRLLSDLSTSVQVSIIFTIFLILVFKLNWVLAGFLSLSSAERKLPINHAIGLKSKLWNLRVKKSIYIYNLRLICASYSDDNRSYSLTCSCIDCRLCLNLNCSGIRLFAWLLCGLTWLSSD